MDSALLVSGSEKASQALRQFLTSARCAERILCVGNGAEARRILLENEIALLIVNAPLSDEFGHELALHAVRTTAAGVLLIVKEETAEAVAEKVEEDGVLVLPKPLNRSMLFQSLRLVRAARNRMASLASENRKLHRKIEEIRTVDRAKCVLIECCGMTEPEAHAFIEKTAMNQRITKMQAALDILGANQ